MKRHIKYNDIGQFRNVIIDLQHAVQYIGFIEETQKPSYDRYIKMPIIKVVASEKIHGTNAGVSFSNSDGLFFQGRKHIITPEKDNFECAFAADQNKTQWINIIRSLAYDHSIDLNKKIITVYYEWCGGSIQGNSSAVSGMDKMSIIFQHFKVSPLEPNEDIPSFWRETYYNYSWIQNSKADIHNIMNFPAYDMIIDFENPRAVQNDLIKLVEEVIEPCSPVGKIFGKENIGEGIVVTFMYKDQLYKFKIKGERHSKSKVKVLKNVDNIKLQKIQDIAQLVTPAWRLEQMYDEANDIHNDKIPTIKNMGKFMKLLNNDIIKEESDIISEAKLEPKDIFSTCSKIAGNWYKDQLDKIAFNK